MRFTVPSILFVTALLSVGCIGLTSFDGFYGKFSSGLQRNGASAQNLLPPTLEQLTALELELTAFQASVAKQASSPNQQAILLLTEAELNLIHMQANVFLAQEQTRLANFAFPACDSSTNIGKALVHFDTALAQATLAAKNFAAFEKEYAQQSAQTGIDFAALQLTLLGSKQSISQSKQTLEQFCP